MKSDIYPSKLSGAALLASELSSAARDSALQRSAPSRRRTASGEKAPTAPLRRTAVPAASRSSPSSYKKSPKAESSVRASGSAPERSVPYRCSAAAEGLPKAAPRQTVSARGVKGAVCAVADRRSSASETFPTRAEPVPTSQEKFPARTEAGDTAVSHRSPPESKTCGASSKTENRAARAACSADRETAPRSASAAEFSVNALSSNAASAG